MHVKKYHCNTFQHKMLSGSTFVLSNIIFLNSYFPENYWRCICPKFTGQWKETKAILKLFYVDSCKTDCSSATVGNRTNNVLFIYLRVDLFRAEMKRDDSSKLLLTYTCALKNIESVQVTDKLSIVWIRGMKKVPLIIIADFYNKNRLYTEQTAAVYVWGILSFCSMKITIQQK